MVDVSVVTPHFNTPFSFLKELHDSISSCGLSVEWVIVDDGSTSEFSPSERFFFDKPWIRWIRQENSGANRARNCGFASSTGRFVKFVDSDDYIEPCMLEKQVEKAMRDSLDVVVSPVQLVGMTRFVRTKSWKRFDPERPVWSHLTHGTGHPAAVMLSRNLVVKVGGWDEDLVADQDGDFLMRCYLESDAIAYLRTTKSFYRNHGKTVRTSALRDEAGILSRMKVARRIFEIIDAGECQKEALEPLAGRLNRMYRAVYPSNPILAAEVRDLARTISPEFRNGERGITNFICLFLGPRVGGKFIDLLKGLRTRLLSLRNS